MVHASPAIIFGAVAFCGTSAVFAQSAHSTNSTEPATAESDNAAVKTRSVPDEVPISLDAPSERDLIELESRKAADYAPAVGMAAKIIGQALNLPSAQNGPPTMGMGMGMGYGMGYGMGGYYKRELEELLGRELSDDEASVLEGFHSREDSEELEVREDEYEALEARKAADYAPAAGFAAKIVGQALGLPSANNGPPTMGMGYGMGYGTGYGMGGGYYWRELEELLGRELSDDEASVLEGLPAREVNPEELEERDDESFEGLDARDEGEYEEIEVRKAADYAPAAGFVAKVVGQALGLPSANNGPPTMGMGYGMGYGMGGGYYKRELEEVFMRELLEAIYDDA